MMDQYGYRHTLRIFLKKLCFYTTKKVTRTLLNVRLHVDCLSSLFRFLRLAIYNVLVFPLILYFPLPCTYYLIIFLEEYSVLKYDTKCINVSDESLAAVMKAETDGFI